MRSLAQTIAEVAAALDAAGLPYMLIGGMANLEWGEPRTTFDLDITVAASDEALVSFAQSLGVVETQDPLLFVRERRVLPVRLDDDRLLDLVAATLQFEFDAIGRARACEIGGRMIAVCTAEDLILHKIVEPRPRDLDDIFGIMKRQKDALDLLYLDPKVAALADLMEQPEILAGYKDAKNRARRAWESGPRR